MWTKITIKKDTDQANEGTVTAVWTDQTTQETFTYSERVRRTASGKTSFITSAKAAQSKWATEKSALKTIENNLLTELNK